MCGLGWLICDCYLVIGSWLVGCMFVFDFVLLILFVVCLGFEFSCLVTLGICFVVICVGVGGSGWFRWFSLVWDSFLLF